MTRLTDNDKRFGRITYGRSNWAALRIAFCSGDDEESRNSLTVNGFGWTARVWLPSIIQPHRIKHHAKSWDAATIERMGRDWYYEVHPREFGMCISDGHLSVRYGPQTNDSVTTKYRGWFLPWTQWRHVRYSLYDTVGNLYWEQRQRKDIRGIAAFTDQYEAQQTCPAAAFVIRDYDGSEVIATTRIDEREWRFGEGWFKWLSLFRKPMVKRSLDISFSAETGTEKGSWKGGTMGTSIAMLPGEMHEAAFRRYCQQEHRGKYRNYRVEFVKKAA